MWDRPESMADAHASHALAEGPFPPPLKAGKAGEASGCTSRGHIPRPAGGVQGRTGACELKTTHELLSARSTSSITSAGIPENRMDTVMKAGDDDIPVRYSPDSLILDLVVSSRLADATHRGGGGVRARDDHELRSAISKQHHSCKYT